MPYVELPPLPADPEFCVVARPNSSLARGERWTVFAALASVSLAVAGGFAAAGAWPILPYSVLEIALLAGAFWYVERRAAAWERIAVIGDRVVVERSVGGQRIRREYNRWWLKVEMERVGHARAESEYLTLRCAGETMNFGDSLPREQRIELARRLRRLTTAG